MAQETPVNCLTDRRSGRLWHVDEHDPGAEPYRLPTLYKNCALNAVWQAIIEVTNDVDEHSPSP